MKRYSNTKISTYQQCRLQYKYKYVDRVESAIDNTVEAFMGDLVHRALEKLYTDLKYEKMNSCEDLITYYDTLWEEEWTDDVLVVKEEYEASHYREKGRSMIKDYYERYHPFDAATTIGIETQHRYEVTNEHNVSIRIDRLDSPEPGVYEIHDYKTSNHLPTQEEAEQDTQLATYALGVKDMYPDADRIKLIWHYLGFDREVVVEKTWDELDDIEEQLAGVIHDIEDNDEYPPSKSPLCHYCGYQPRCPLWKDKFEEGPTDIDTDELVSEYISLKKEKDRVESEIDGVKDKLSTYMEERDVDRVFDNTGRNVYRWSKDVVKFPMKTEEQDELWDALDALGILDEFLKVDTWALENDYDDLDELYKEVLSKLGEQKTIERFYYND